MNFAIFFRLICDPDDDDQDKEQDAQPHRDIGKHLFRTSLLNVLEKSEIRTSGKC